MISIVRLLLEVSIDQLRKQFVETGKISKENFNRIVTLFGNQSNYATWLVKKVADKLIPPEEIEIWKPTLQVFERYKSRFPIKDINQIKTQQQIYELLEIVQNIQNSVEVKKISGSGKKEDEDLVQKSFVANKTTSDGRKWKIYCPINYEAERLIGSGTGWCTVANKHYYDMYLKNGGKYVIFINASNPKEKYQLHTPSDQFKDPGDYELKDERLRLELETAANDLNLVEGYTIDTQHYKITSNLPEVTQSLIDEFVLGCDQNTAVISLEHHKNVSSEDLTRIAIALLGHYTDKEVLDTHYEVDMLYRTYKGKVNIIINRSNNKFGYYCAFPEPNWTNGTSFKVKDVITTKDTYLKLQKILPGIAKIPSISWTYGPEVPISKLPTVGRLLDRFIIQVWSGEHCPELTEELPRLQENNSTVAYILTEGGKCRYVIKKLKNRKAVLLSADKAYKKLFTAHMTDAFSDFIKILKTSKQVLQFVYELSKLPGFERFDVPDVPGIARDMKRMFSSWHKAPNGLEYLSYSKDDVSCLLRHDNGGPCTVWRIPSDTGVSNDIIVFMPRLFVCWENNYAIITKTTIPGDRFAAGVLLDAVFPVELEMPETTALSKGYRIRPRAGEIVDVFGKENALKLVQVFPDTQQQQKEELQAYLTGRSEKKHYDAWLDGHDDDEDDLEAAEELDNAWLDDPAEADDEFFDGLWE